MSQNISYASVIKGDANKLSEGLVCRPKKIKMREIVGGTKKSDIKKTPKGGVKLPFDK